MHLLMFHWSMYQHILQQFPPKNIASIIANVYYEYDVMNDRGDVTYHGTVMTVTSYNNSSVLKDFVQRTTYDVRVKVSV